jgi:hypothetical protein
MKKQITKRALIERIRRKLNKDAIQFRTNRGGPYTEGIGKFFLVDQNNHITGPRIDDLEAYGRELGVLRDYEILAKD